MLHFIFFSFLGYAEESIFLANLKEWRQEKFNTLESKIYYSHQNSSLNFLMQKGYTTWDKEKKCSELKSKSEIKIKNRIFCQNDGLSTRTITTFIKSNTCKKCYQYYSISFQKNNASQILNALNGILK